MKMIKRILISCLAVLLIGAAGYGIYYLVHYINYDEYKDSIAALAYEEGTEFSPIAESSSDVTDMVLAAENQNFKLYTDTTTGNVAVYDKRTKKTTYTNPVHPEEDTIAVEVNQSYLKSQLVVEYYNANDKPSSFNSYDAVIANNQLEIEKIDQGFRYIYTFGKNSSATGIVPVYISEERLAVYTDKLIADGNEKAAKFIKNRYVKSKKVDGFLEILPAAAKGQSTLREMQSYYELAGYTEEDYVKDMEASGVEVEIPLSFVVPMEYRLEEDGIRVSINTEHILEHGGGKINRIQMLRYFAAGTNQEDGYIVLPNGSGSLMYFNNQKSSSAEYSQYIYGNDPLAISTSVAENTETARLPIFGIQGANQTVFARINSGDSFALLTAGVAGRYNSYNYVYPTFILRNIDVIEFEGSVGKESEAIVVEPDLYKANLEVKYSLLDKDHEGYSGMASYYRDELLAEGKLTQKASSTGIPFYMDVLGGVKRTDYILGKQIRTVYAATTYEEAKTMASQLNDLDVHNIVMNYQGWFNGGYYHDAADRIKLVKKLGSESKMEELSAFLSADGGKFYADTAFQKVTYISKHYKDTVETARYYSNSYQAIFGQVNPATLFNISSLGYRETLYYLLSPKFLPRYVGKFADAVSDIDITGISLRDLGDTLVSDKKRSEPISRDEAKQIVVDQFDKLQATNKALMVSGGNEYSLPYASDLINIPLAHNDFFIVDEEIPFMEMVLHGCVDYCGSNINLMDTEDINDIELKLIEYGAAPHFVFTYEESTELKYTGLNRYYSTKFENWKELAAQIYTKVNSVLSYVENAKITSHQILAPGVKKVTYDNGVIIYVNSTDREYTAAGLTIPAKSYEMEGQDK